MLVLACPHRNTSTHTCTRTCTHTCTRTCTHVRAHTHTHAYPHKPCYESMRAHLAHEVGHVDKLVIIRQAGVGGLEAWFSVDGRQVPKGAVPPVVQLGYAGARTALGASTRMCACELCEHVCACVHVRCVCCTCARVGLLLPTNRSMQGTPALRCLCVCVCAYVCACVCTP